MSNESARVDVYTRVTDQIIKAIEQGAGDWEMPWHVSDPLMVTPRNASTGNRYRGVNVVGLWVSSYLNGFTQPVWATFQQWQELGCAVRKGEKCTVGVFWKRREEVEAEAGETSSEAETKGPKLIARSFPLFNACQVDGFQIEEAEPVDPVERIDAAERFFKGVGAKVQEGGNIAAYNKRADVIRMPPFEAFKDPVAFYATLAHECTHWTGHETRLNRDLTGRFGDESYAAEELIAELGAAFIAADLNLTTEPRGETAAYVDSWLRILRADKRAIFVAAGHAQRAADYMHDRIVGPAPDAKEHRNAGNIVQPTF